MSFERRFQPGERRSDLLEAKGETFDPLPVILRPGNGDLVAASGERLGEREQWEQMAVARG
jgi:hypothetical protein